MKVTRSSVSVTSELTVDEDLDFLTLYQAKGLANPATGEALKKGYAGIVNADINASANIALSKLVSTYLSSVVLTTRGDILKRGASNPLRLAKGASGTVLTMGTDDPAWTTEAVLALLTTRGDIVYKGASALARLAKGAEGLALIMGANDPAWSALPIVTVRKTADQTVNNSDTLVNDTHLLHGILANEVWYYEFLLKTISASATPDYDFTIVVPSGATGKWLLHNMLAGLSGESGTAGIAFATLDGLTSSATELLFFLRAIVINGATPGNVQLQWCQRTATVEDTKVLANSFLRATKIG